MTDRSSKNPFRVRLRRFARAVWRSPARVWWRDHQWLVIWTLALVTITLGYIGFAKHFTSHGQSMAQSDVLYRSLQLFVLESGSVEPPIPLELNLARWLAPFIAAYTAVQALAVVFYQQFQWFRLRKVRNHVVVCGLGEKGLLMVNRLLDNDEQVVVIEQNEANGFLQQCRQQGAIIVFGDAADRETLLKARVDKAKHIISLCGDDGANVKVAVNAGDFIRERQTRSLTCLIHIADLQLYRLLKQKEVEWEEGPHLRREFFNVYDNGARRLLSEHLVFSRDGCEAETTPRLVVVGLSRLGESLVVKAGAGWSARPAATTNRLKITVVDADAEHKRQLWRSRYPLLESTVELRWIAMDVEHAEVEQAEFLSDATSVYVCVADEAEGLSAGLSLHRKASRTTRIIVCLNEDTGLAGLLQEGGGFDNLRVFGLLSRTCSPDLLPGGAHETLARLFHEEYVRHQQRAGVTSQTNPALVPWESLPDELQELNRLQADHIGVKLAAVGCGIEALSDWRGNSFEFKPDEIEAMARMEHERWMAERLLEGAVYGPVRDERKKINPNLVDWRQLPEEIKKYNLDAMRELPEFLARAGFQIYRLK